MKIGVVSDTHGSTDGAVEALKNIKDLKLIIHLGDHVKDARKIEAETGIEVVYVRGNCDHEDEDVPHDKVFQIEGKKIFITHGHKYNAYSGVSDIFYKGKEEDADIILFGHSHISTKILHENVLILNPGSPIEPRNGSKKSIGMIEISEKEIKAEIILL